MSIESRKYFELLIQVKLIFPIHFISLHFSKTVKKDILMSLFRSREKKIGNRMGDHTQRFSFTVSAVPFNLLFYFHFISFSCISLFNQLFSITFLLFNCAQLHCKRNRFFYFFSYACCFLFYCHRTNFSSEKFRLKTEKFFFLFFFYFFSCLCTCLNSRNRKYLVSL